MGHTAFLIVDAQNAFCSAGGSFRQRGYILPCVSATLRVMDSMLAMAHKRGDLVAFTQLAYAQAYRDAGLLVHDIAPAIKKLGAYLAGTWDSEVYGFENRLPSDIVIRKRRYDPFFKTDLERMLVRNQVGRIVVAGLLTNVCVESCVRSAFDRDYQVVVVSDGCTTYSKALHHASLETMDKHLAHVLPFKSLEGFLDDHADQKPVTEALHQVHAGQVAWRRAAARVGFVSALQQRRRRPGARRG